MARSCLWAPLGAAAMYAVIVEGFGIVDFIRAVGVGDAAAPTTSRFMGAE